MFPAVCLSRALINGGVGAGGSTLTTSRALVAALRMQRQRQQTTAASHHFRSSSSSSSSSLRGGSWMMVVGGLVLATHAATAETGFTTTTTIKTTKADVVGVLGGTPIQEPVTGILFPKLVNGFYFAGCGVRIKYVFVKVYAVASYFDPLAMSAVKHNPLLLQEALLNPTYPRTIKIIMNRKLSADKMTTALIEALEPRMAGQDLDKLEEFKQMNPAVDLVKGAEIEMTIRGDTFLYKNAVGGLGTIKSTAFCKAMCDTFYGLDPVSPPHKQSVLDGIAKM